VAVDRQGGLRVRLKLEFDGALFCGWQLQAPDRELEHPSIQGVLERALTIGLRTGGRRLVVQGCGRTDAGVHAEEFFAHVDLPEEFFAVGGVGAAADSARASIDPVRVAIALEKLRHTLNALLPDSVAVTAIAVAPGFHALDDVRRKTYEYRLLLRRTKPTLLRGRVHWLPLEPAAFDVAAVRRAMALLEGEHDFRAFAAANASVVTTVRKLNKCELREGPPFPETLAGAEGVAAFAAAARGSTSEPRTWDASIAAEPLSAPVVREATDFVRAGGPSERLLVLRFTGEGFLKQMVRNLSGTLVEVGEGRRTPESVRELLATTVERGEARKLSGPCLPPEGLHLVRVEY
jgi:tRNA pseudouridine38-40 synthase